MNKSLPLDIFYFFPFIPFLHFRQPFSHIRHKSAVDRKVVVSHPRCTLDDMKMKMSRIEDRNNDDNKPE